MRLGRSSAAGALDGSRWGMPERWVVRLAGRGAEQVELAHLHAALSHWFDHRPAEGAAPGTDTHTAVEKDYSVSAPTLMTLGGLSVTVGTLTGSAAVALLRHATPGQLVRLGSASLRITEPPELESHRTWAELASDTGARAWTLDFQSPTSFLRGQRTSPLPTPEVVLRGLMVDWRTWADATSYTPPEHTPSGVIVTEIDGTTERLQVGHRWYRGFVGRVRFSADETSAPLVAPLFALAPFTGVGAGTRKGLGTVRLVETSRPAAARMSTAT